MNLLFTERAWEDYLYWQSHDTKVLEKVHSLLKDVKCSPFQGLGKPEPLKANLAGWWSRRITGEHRLVYRIIGKDDDRHIEVVQCRYHY